MAGNTVDFNIVATFDGKAVETALARMRAEVQSFNSYVAKSSVFPEQNVAAAKNLESQMLTTLSSIKGVNVETVKLSSAADNLTQKFVNNQMGLRDLFTMMRQNAKGVAGDLNTIADQQAKIAKGYAVPSAMNDGTAHFITSQNALADATVKSQKTVQAANTAWAQFSTGLTNLGKNTQWAGRQLTVGLTVPLAAAAAGLADYADKVNKNLTFLSRVYGIGGNAGGQFQNVLPDPKQLQVIRDQVIGLSQDMAKMYGTSAQETTGVAAQLAAVGYTNQQLISLTRSTVQAMALGDVTQQDALKGVIALQNVYKLSTTDVGNAMNFLSSAQASTAASMGELIQAMPKVGPLAVSLGANYKDVVAMLVAMREGGIGAVEGANALKTSIQRLVSPTKAATEQMAGFGINIKQIVQSNAGNLVGMIEALQQALSHLDPLQKSQALTELFGKMQAVRMEALINNFNTLGSQSAKVMQMAQLSPSQIADIAKHETAQLQQSLSGQFKIAVESLKTSLLPIGEQFLRDATGFINVIAKIAHYLGALKPYANIFKYLILGIAAAGPLLMFAGLLMNLIGYLTKLYNGFRMFKQGVKEAFDPASPQGFFSSIASSFNNYFTEIDKAEIAQQQLADATKQSAEQQVESLNQVISALQQYTDAIKELQTAALGPIATGQNLINPATEENLRSQGGGTKGSKGKTGILEVNIGSKTDERTVQQKLQRENWIWNTPEEKSQLVEKIMKAKPELTRNEAEQALNALGMSAQRDISGTGNPQYNLRGTSPFSRFFAGNKAVYEGLAQLRQGDAAAQAKYQEIKQVFENLNSSEEQMIKAMKDALSSMDPSRVATLAKETQIQYEEAFAQGDEALQAFFNSLYKDIENAQEAAGVKVGRSSARFSRVVKESLAPLASKFVSELTSAAPGVFSKAINALTPKKFQNTFAIGWKDEQLALADNSKSGFTTTYEGSHVVRDVVQKATEDEAKAADDAANAANAHANAENDAAKAAEDEAKATEDAAAAAAGRANAENDAADALNGEANAADDAAKAANAHADAQIRAAEAANEVTDAMGVVVASAEDLASANVEAAELTIMAAEEQGRGKMLGGIGMAVGMLAPMIAQPLSNKFGGSGTTVGGGISGAGSGAMYGSMLGMAFGPEGAGIGAIAGALIGGVVGAFQGHAQEIQQQIQEKTQGLTAAFTLSGNAIDQFHLKANSLANYDLPMMTQGLSANQSAVQSLANSYKSATDVATQSMLKLVAAGGQMSQQILSGQVNTMLLRGAGPAAAQSNALGIIAAAGGGVLQQRQQALYVQQQIDLYKKGGTSGVVQSLMNAAGITPTSGISGTSTTAYVEPNAVLEAGGRGSGYAQSNPANYVLQSNGPAMAAATNLENTLLTALNPVQFQKELAPMQQLFGNLGQGTNASKQQLMAFNNTIQQFAPQLAPLISQVENMKSSFQGAQPTVQNMATAVNLMANGFITSAGELEAAAGNLMGYLSGVVNYASETTATQAQTGTTGLGSLAQSTAAATSQAAYSQNLGSPAVPASGGGGGGGSGTSANAVYTRGIKLLTDQARALQKEIDARDANIQVMQAQTNAVQANYDAQQKIIQASGSGDAVAAAQAQADATQIASLQNQIVTTQQIDALDKQKIATIQNQITDLQAAGGDPRAIAAMSKLYTDQMRLLQKEIDARDELVKITQEQVQNTETLMGLQNQQIQARGAGDLLGAALAQSSYNNQQNMARVQLTADKADYAAKEQITYLQNKITDLQSANQATIAAAGPGGGGGGSGKVPAQKAVPPTTMTTTQQNAYNQGQNLDILGRGYVAGGSQVISNTVRDRRGNLIAGTQGVYTTPLRNMAQATQAVTSDKYLMNLIKQYSKDSGVPVVKAIQVMASEILHSAMNTKMPVTLRSELVELHKTTHQMFAQGKIDAATAQKIESMSLQAQVKMLSTAHADAATALATADVQHNTALLTQAEAQDGISQAHFDALTGSQKQDVLKTATDLVQGAIHDGNSAELSRWGNNPLSVQTAINNSVQELITKMFDSTQVLGSTNNPMTVQLSGTVGGAVIPVTIQKQTHAIGGLITGPGTSTSDSIPSMLSNGEYVVRASSVNKFGKGFLDAVNAGTYVPPISGGNTSISSAQMAPAMSSNPVYNISVNVDGRGASGEIDPDKIASVVRNVLDRRERVNGTRRSIG